MNHFSLALLGDGVWARWNDCREFQNELARLYTQSSFEILNCGLEGARVGNALHRVCVPAQSAGKVIPALSVENPTVVLVESCAYSQFWDGPEGMSEYRDLLRRLWDEILLTTTAKPLFCLAPAPSRDRFLEGDPLFANASKATRARFADTVKMFLTEAREIANDEGWPVADIGEEVEKLVKGGESARRFFDQSDGAGLSRYGYTVAARVIVRQLDNQRFIEERISK